MLHRKGLHGAQDLELEECPLSSCDLGQATWPLSLSVLICKMELVLQQTPEQCLPWVKFMNDGESYRSSSAYHVVGTLPALPHSTHNKTLWQETSETETWRVQQYSEWKSEGPNPSPLTSPSLLLWLSFECRLAYGKGLWKLRRVRSVSIVVFVCSLCWIYVLLLNSFFFFFFPQC